MTTVGTLLKDMRATGAELMINGVKRPEHIVVVTAVGDAATELLKAAQDLYQRMEAERGWKSVTDGEPPIPLGVQG